ncbi:(2Fe-2S)-binding protein [Fontisphaera persica]|uniref:(2Fe-2S)-binding protein n=1 Tax=Fontisphaera persica TaxID=2974023 RepID=UPI0024BF9622|nr:(2Fe-2S)-binding protein [Fontisphaera persica]WCJ60409.1 (2Fe-2S)-binding protein [Fontisphaera persica]
MPTAFTLTVNGRRHTVTTDPARPLLQVLREDLGLTGTKYGCGEGQCGACTVLMDGRREHACLVPVKDAVGRLITTIEGLSPNGQLHPVQRIFLEEVAMQCGYCTSGMIMATVALLRENPSPSPQEILAWMNPHICRCCGYPRILKAVRRAVAEHPKAS